MATDRIVTDADATLEWRGVVLSVQPRIRLTRSFDERSHSYLGYVLRVRGTLDGEARDFVIAVGKGAHEKHGFCARDQVEAKGVRVADSRLETADLYKVSGLKVVARGPDPAGDTPPFLGIPPALAVYRERGHRRLAARTYSRKCWTCIWGCEMVAEMIVDHWNPSKIRYRRETFCYGPKSCSLYKAGPTRKVPGRKACPGRKRTGSMKTRRRTGARKSDPMQPGCVVDHVVVLSVVRENADLALVLVEIDSNVLHGASIRRA